MEAENLKLGFVRSASLEIIRLLYDYGIEQAIDVEQLDFILLNNFGYLIDVIETNCEG